MRALLEVGLPGTVPPPAAPLGAVARLLGRLHAEQVAYCQWKSNEHLDAALAGDTDLDLLVARQAAPLLAEIFGQMAVKRFDVAPFHSYPGVEDWLCVDPGTGKLVHLHVHYQLTVGEKHLNGHRLPWEDLVLRTRLRDARHEIYVADPHVELLLLVTRAAVKLRLRDRLRAVVGRTYLEGKARKEFEWLVPRVDAHRLREMAGPLVGARAARALADMASGGLSRDAFLAFRRSAAPVLDSFRIYTPWGSRSRRWLREAQTLWWLAANQYHRVPGNSSRTSPHGGVVIAFLGETGSSVAREIAAWLAQEVAVLPVTAAARVPEAAWRAQSAGKIVIAAGWPEGAERQPDVVVRLRGGAGVTRAGRADPAADRTVDIDAARPFAQVLLAVKSALWENL